MKVLLTGSTGYIGRRLAVRLLEREDVNMRLLVRNAKKLEPAESGNAEIIEGSTFDKKALGRAVVGIDTAYYLIHSMGERGGDFEQLDRRSAENFREACIGAGVKRIVYLGGLGRIQNASRHLRSRIETGEILSARPEKIQTLWFRAGIVIGSGSAGFEIVRNLVEKLPVMIAPRWVDSRTQPVSIRDVLLYLEGALDVQEKEDWVIDIGSKIITFKTMMLETARVMGLRRWIIKVPLFTPRLSSYWLVLFTPVPYGIASSLVEGLKSETIIENEVARKMFPGIVPLSFPEAVAEALLETENNEIISRWCDGTAGDECDIESNGEISGRVYHIEIKQTNAALSSGDIFNRVVSLGGERGWLSFPLLWRVRGIIDKLAGGYGINRGRRHPDTLRLGDSVDFWRVVDYNPGKRLLLFSQMRLPGKGWLEFNVGENSFVVRAHFIPRGIMGRLYWVMLYPAHRMIFRKMARGISERSCEA